MNRHLRKADAAVAQKNALIPIHTNTKTIWKIIKPKVLRFDNN